MKLTRTAKKLANRIAAKLAIWTADGIDRPELPQWIKDAEPSPIVDDVIKDGWDLNVLNCANQTHTPAKLGYSRKGGWGVWGPGETHYKYIATFLDLRGLRVLELGPHEGHHSILIEKMGARECVCLEGNELNMSKCQRIKEKYGLARTTYIKINVEDLYEGKVTAPFGDKFDIVFCSGFLYHLPDPGKALRYFKTQSETLFLCTHYYEERAFQLFKPRMGTGRYQFRKGDYRFDTKVYEGLWYSEFDPQNQQPGTQDGASQASFWPSDRGLSDLLARVGYRAVHVLGKDIVNGMPYIYIIAKH